MEVKIYGRAGCKNCEAAKVKFFRAKLQYDYLMVDDHKEELAKQFETLPMSLPYIVVDNSLISYEKLDEFLKSKK